MLARRNKNTIIPGRLRALAPFSGLPAEQLIVAAGRASSDRFNDGEVVIALGADDESDYFLLDGKLLISDVDGKSKLVTAGSAEALNVIAPLRPSIYNVRASGLALCARIPRAEVAVLREQVERINQSSFKEVDTEPSATQGLLFDLEADVAADRLKLPSLPDIALRIREVLSNRVCDNQRVADLLSTDPSAAAKILKIANSPLCRGVSTIMNLREAVARIGMHTVSELVICFSLKDLFDTSAPDVRKLFAHIVGESVRIGATGSVIAERASTGNAEQALVAGLLSNIGAFPILERLAMRPDVVQDPSKAEAAIEAHGAQIGVLICRKWNFGDAVIEAVSENRNWAFVSHGELTLAEIVICARYHVLLSLGQIQNLPKPEQIRAMRVLGGEVTPEMSLEIIKDAKERIDVLLDTLS